MYLVYTHIPIIIYVCVIIGLVVQGLIYTFIILISLSFSKWIG